MSIKSIVSAYMSPHPVTVPATAEASVARDLFVQHRFTIAPVVDEAGRCVGVVSASDFVRDGFGGDGFVRDGFSGDGEASSARVSDLMSRDLVALSPDHRVTQAAAVLASRGVHHAVVLGPDGCPAGVLSTVDVARAVADSDLDQPADVLMTEELVSVDPGESPRAARDLLRDGGFTAAPVLDAGELVGIVNQRVLLRGEDEGATRVDDIMDTNLVTMDSHATVADVARVLAERDARRVFLVDEAREILGVVTTSDLTGYVASLYEAFGD